MVSERPDPTETEISAPAPVAISDRRRLGFGLFFAAFLFYIPLLPTTISRGGDCGELTAASWRLGIGHPTGYPLYLLAGKAFATLIPFGQIAWRYNLFSALLAAIATALVGMTAHSLLYPDGRRQALWASGGASAMLTGGYYFASQALIAEVYALNALLLAALLYCAVAWHQNEDWRWFYSLALVAGLTLVTHLSCLFLVPSLFLLAFWQQRRRFLSGRTSQRLVPTALLVLFSATLLLYLPLRSGLFPQPPVTQPINRSVYWPLDWGHPATLGQLKNHALAKQYNDLLLKPGQINVAGKTLHVPEPVLPFPKWIPKFTGWLNLGLLQLLWASPLLLVGAIASWRRRGIGLALTLVVVLNSVEFGYMVSDLSNFFFPTYIVGALWLAFGFAEAARWSQRFTGRARWRYTFVAQSVLVVTVACQWLLFATTSGWQGYTLAHDAALEQANGAEAIEKSTGRHPVVCLPTDDFRWAFWYARFVEGRGAGATNPWGRAFTYAKDHGQLGRSLASWQVNRPVAIGWLDDSFAADFNYQPANESGNLWLLSSHSITPVELKTAGKSLGPNGLAGAKVRRHPIWRPDEKGVPKVLRGGLVALDLDFEAAPLAKSGAHEAFVEVLFAKPDQFSATPSPTQPGIVTGEDFDRAVPVWRQRRRFELPAQFSPASAWRTSVPLQIDDDAPTVQYDMWTRIIRDEHDTSTPWTPTDQIRVVTQ